MKSNEIKTAISENWADVYEQIETYLKDESVSFGKRASVALDMLDLGLPSLARLELLTSVDIQISGDTDSSKKTFHYTLESRYDKVTDEDIWYIKKTENEEGVL